MNALAIAALNARPVRGLRPRTDGNWPAIAAYLVGFAGCVRRGAPTQPARHQGEFAAYHAALMSAAADLRLLTVSLRKPPRRDVGTYRLSADTRATLGERGLPGGDRAA